MEKLLSVHENKGTKQAKAKKTKKPVKIVYISSPMKVKTTASEFRALVQELTGRDSGVPDSTKYPEIDGSDEIIVSEDQNDEVPRVLEPAGNCEVPVKKRPESDDAVAFEPYDDVFVPQVFDNFPVFFPSNLLCG